MKNAFYWTIRFFVKYLYLKLVFYKVEKNGWDKIPKDVPILFAVTHPLMYIDALVLGCTYNQPLYFITKSTVFKGSFNKWVFKKLNMIPVVRKQDAPKGQPFSNKDMFKYCISTLTEGGDILIFSEGTSVWERKLRGIKSGTARIALETEVSNNFELNVHIVPIALNYTHINSVFPSVSIEVGDPIKVKDYKEDYDINSSRTAQNITKKIEEELQKRYFTLPDLDEERPLVQAVTMYTETTIFHQKSSLHDYFSSLKTALDYLEKAPEEVLSELKNKIIDYSHQLEKNRFLDQSFWNKGISHKGILSLFIRTVVTLLLFPFHSINWVLNKIPYKICKTIALKSSKEMEVWGANLIALCGIIFPLFYCLYLFIFIQINGTFSWSMLLLVVTFPFFTYASYFFNNYIKKLYSDLRLYFSSKQKNNIYLSLLQQRSSIVNSIDNIISKYEKEV